MSTLHAVNFFPGDGVTTQWDFQFDGVNPDNASGTKPYLYDKNVKAQEIWRDVDGVQHVVQRDVELISADTVRVLGDAIPVGHEVKVYRETENRYPLVDYRDRQTVSEADLDLSARQTLFVTMETFDQSTLAVESANRAEEVAAQANATANEANDTADNALVIAQDANAKSDTAIAASADAVTRSETALQNANLALQAAQDVEIRADEAAQSALQAEAAANAAREFAEEAVSTANGVDGKATLALSQSSQAQTQAAQALATANGVDAKATDALASADAALLVANDASTKADEAKAVADGVDAKADSAITTANVALVAANQATTDVAAMDVRVVAAQETADGAVAVNDQQAIELLGLHATDTRQDGELEALRVAMLPRKPELVCMGGGVVMYVVNGQLFVSMATAYANGAGRDGLSGLENMTQVALPAKVVDMFTTGWASWVLLENKELWVCGLNTYGALGIGDTTSPAYFVKSTDNVDQMYYSPSMLDRGSALAANRMFIRKGAQLYGAGYNANGALGIGTTANASSWTLVPIPVDGDTLVRNLGAQFGCLVVVRRRTTPSAGVWVCGYNGARQLGTPVAGNVLSLTDVSSEWGLGGSSLNTIVDAQGGFGYATTAESGNSVLFIRNGFEIMACGYGGGGLLGNGGTASTTVPVLAHQTTSRIVQFTVHGGGFGHAFSVHEDGSVFCWGSNQNGQLGLGDTAQRNSPTSNPALTGKTTKVATQTSRNSYSHNGGILFDMRDTEGHQVVGYTGGTSYGENAGDTPSSGVMFPRLPVFDSRGERIVYEHFGVGATASATVGLATFVAVTDRGAVYSWGHNNQGLVYLPAANLGALFTAPHPWERNNV